MMVGYCYIPEYRNRQIRSSRWYTYTIRSDTAQRLEHSVLLIIMLLINTCKTPLQTEIFANAHV